MRLPLIVLVGLLATACTPIPSPQTEGEKLYPRNHSASYTCSIDQWEIVKRRITACEAQGSRSKPFEGCPPRAIRAECTWKGAEIDVLLPKSGTE